MISISQICLFFAYAMTCLLSSVYAAEESIPSRIDPEAQVVIQKYQTYLGNLESLTANVSSFYKVNIQGMEMDFTVKNTIAAKRPNKLLLTTESSGINLALICCDGSKIYGFSEPTNMYAEINAPDNFMRFEFNETSLSTLTSIGDLVLAPEDTISSLSHLTEARYLGIDEIDGVKCDHLRVTIAAESAHRVPSPVLDLWFESSLSPLLRRIVPDMEMKLQATKSRDQPNDPNMAEIMNVMKMEAVTDIVNWQVNPCLANALFTFKPPKEAQKVDDLLKALMSKAKEHKNPQEDNTDSEEDHPKLEGNPAPMFKLKLAEGGDFDLSAQQDKKIVILDFWATWCPPCRKGLPIIAKVAEAYRNQNVILIAVNERETASVVNEFLRRQNLNIQVALDENGSAGQSYRLSCIPTTVIIGKDGIVYKVHMGLLSEIELKNDLDNLIRIYP